MIRFDVGGAVTTGGGTSGIFRLYDNTDNPTYDDQDGNAPLADVWLSGVTVTSFGAFKFEVGLCNSDKSSFAPYYASYGTLSTAGGMVANFVEGQPNIPVSATRLLCVRLTVYTNATVFAAGHLDIRRR